MHTFNFIPDKPQYNEVYSVQRQIPTTYAVTLAEVKSHLRVTFTEDDTYITFLIQACSGIVERFISQSLMQGTQVSCIISNADGNIELPYGPVINILSIKDGNGCTITDYKLLDCSPFNPLFQLLEWPLNCKIKLEYEAGYDVLPADIKLALLQEIGYRYEHRGDDFEMSGLSPSSRTILSSHRRLIWV